MLFQNIDSVTGPMTKNCYRNLYICLQNHLYGNNCKFMISILMFTLILDTYISDKKGKAILIF